MDKIVRVVDLGCERDDRSKRRRLVVDLGLWQVERVLSFDTAGRDVVAYGVADDLTGAVDHQRAFRLGNVPGAVAADGDLLAWSGDPEAHPLEEDLRPIRFVDDVVDALGLRLFHAGVTTAHVGDPGAPDFLPVDRSLERHLCQRGPQVALLNPSQRDIQIGLRKLKRGGQRGWATRGFDVDDLIAVDEPKERFAAHADLVDAK